MKALVVATVAFETDPTHATFAAAITVAVCACVSGVPYADIEPVMARILEIRDRHFPDEPLPLALKIFDADRFKSPEYLRQRVEDVGALRFTPCQLALLYSALEWVCEDWTAMATKLARIGEASLAAAFRQKAADAEALQAFIEP